MTVLGRSYNAHANGRSAQLGREDELSRILLPANAWTFASLAAPFSSPVLLYGETGSGKTYLAQLIHQLSPRSSEPFVPVNCAAIPQGLFESEMFGHVRGAFTGATDSRPGLFELADRGTFFLDELGELPLSVQPKFLRVLETDSIRRVGSTRQTTVDVRLVAATHRDLWEMVQKDQFREDLYFRCSVLEFRLPPLRERREEFREIIACLLARAVSPGDLPEICTGALEILWEYPWPGNLRELNNVLRRACIFSAGGPIEPKHLPERICRFRARASTELSGQDGARPRPRYTPPDSAEQERSMILEALRAERGNKTRVAKRLGMARSTLWVKLKQYGLEADSESHEPRDSDES